MPKIHNNYRSQLLNKMNNSLFNVDSPIVMDLYKKKTYQLQPVLNNNDDYVDVRDVVDDFFR
tara:strand:+ start:791 stop:976 length:186 start_codon:yes stop_codon:yes gene_type:complete